VWLKGNMEHATLLATQPLILAASHATNLPKLAQSIMITLTKPWISFLRHL
jgi:hypothetical protein